jgi:hypothetical protein
VIEDVAALAYLDARAAINGIKSIVRDPKRLLAWSVYGILIANSWFQRSMQRSFRLHGGFDQTWVAVLSPAILALVPAALLAFLGFTVLSSAIRARPRIGFTWPADGRFLCGSALAPRVVVAWLQLRTSLGLLLRWPLLILIIAGFPGIAQASLSAIFYGGMGVAAAMLLNWQAGNAAGLLSRWARTPLIVAGAAMLAGGLGSFVPPLVLAARDSAHAISIITAHAFATLPGTWLAGAMDGDALDIIPLLVLALLAGSAAAWAAGDCYPELWQAASRTFVLRQIARRRSLWEGVGESSLQRQLEAADLAPGAKRKARATHSAADTALSGAWTILWKDWIAMRRGPIAGWGPLGRIALIALIAAAVGIGLSTSDVSPSTVDAMLIGLSIAGTISYMQILALTSATVAADLRMPIWALSASPLPVRLFAWTCAASWRPALGCALALTALGVAGHVPLLAMAAFPAALFVTIVTRIVGLAAFTILPHQGDIRGPAAMLRLAIIYLLVLPAAVVGVPVGLWSGLAAGIASAAVVALIESAALLLFAGTRLDGNAMAYNPAATFDGQ